MAHLDFTQRATGQGQDLSTPRLRRAFIRHGGSEAVAELATTRPSIAGGFSSETETTSLDLSTPELRRAYLRAGGSLAVAEAAAGLSPPEYASVVQNQDLVSRLIKEHDFRPPPDMTNKQMERKLGEFDSDLSSIPRTGSDTNNNVSSDPPASTWTETTEILNPGGEDTHVEDAATESPGSGWFGNWIDWMNAEGWKVVGEEIASLAPGPSGPGWISPNVDGEREISESLRDLMLSWGMSIDQVAEHMETAYELAWGWAVHLGGTPEVVYVTPDLDNINGEYKNGDSTFSETVDGDPVDEHDERDGGEKEFVETDLGGGGMESDPTMGYGPVTGLWTGRSGGSEAKGSGQQGDLVKLAVGLGLLFLL